MDELETIIRPSDPRFKVNDAHHRELAEQLRTRLLQVREGGGERYQQRTANRASCSCATASTSCSTGIALS